MLDKRSKLELEVKDLKGLEKVVHKLLEKPDLGRIITFSGEIGAGKTSLIQAFCHHLGIDEPVTSPTFSLINEYTYLDQAGKTQFVYHMDLYRLKEAEEALAIGIEEYLDDDEAYCLIEWPEVIENLLPEDSVRINIRIMDDSTRKILIL